MAIDLTFSAKVIGFKTDYYSGVCYFGKQQMKINCTGCNNTYNIEDNLLPLNKNLIFTCKACCSRIKISKKAPKKNIDPKVKSEPKRQTAIKENSSKQKNGSNELKDQIIEGIKDLPPMPHVVIKAQHLIMDPNSNARKVSAVIESDQAIATQVLKMANSAYYGMSGMVSSVQHATIVLGYQTLGEILTMAGLSGVLMRKLPGYGYDSKDLWKHSLSVALASKLIAEKKNKNLVNEAHTAGLIHDIGKVMLDHHIQKHRDQIDDFMKTQEKTFLDAERHFFGFDHAEIAYDICRKWNIPENISHSIKCHHQPSISGQDEISYIIHMADYIAMMGGIGYDDDDTLYQPEEGAMDFLGLKQNGVGEIMLKVMESANKL